MTLSDRDIRLRRTAIQISFGGAFSGTVLTYLICFAIGADRAFLGAQMTVTIGLFAFPLATNARPENWRHATILAGAALTMPIAGTAAFDAVLAHAPPKPDLGPLEYFAVVLLAYFVALIVGVASWLAVRLATRRASLWRSPATDDTVGDGK